MGRSAERSEEKFVALVIVGENDTTNTSRWQREEID